MKKLKKFIARNKEGAFYGGLIFLILFIMREKIPFIQKLMVGNAWLGNLSTFLFLGISVGILADHWYRPLK